MLKHFVMADWKQEPSTYAKRLAQAIAKAEQTPAACQQALADLLKFGHISQALHDEVKAKIVFRPLLEINFSQTKPVKGKGKK